MNPIMLVRTSISIIGTCVASTAVSRLIVGLIPTTTRFMRIVVKIGAIAVGTAVGFLLQKPIEKSFDETVESVRALTNTKA